MSDPIWGPKGFWADKHAAEQGHPITPSGDPYSLGSFAGRRAKGLNDSATGVSSPAGAFRINNHSTVTDPVEKINQDVQIKLEKSRSRTKLIRRLCKEFNGHLANGTALSYCESLSKSKQIKFMRFLHDVYNYSGIPTPDDEIIKINEKDLLAKIAKDILNGKFQNYVKEHDDAILEQLNDLLEDINKYVLMQQNIEAKKLVLERQKVRYQRMTPYRKISNVVTPVLNGLMSAGILTSLFFVVSQPQALATNAPAYTHYVTTNALNVRDGAGTQFNIASDPLSNGECIKVENFTNKGWARIVLENNRSGFVHGDYIKRRPSGYRCPE